MQSFRRFATNRITYWIDTIVFSALIAFTGGVDSMFFFFLFFPIIVAAFSDGLVAGQKVTAFSVLIFTIVGLLFVPPGKNYDLGLAIMRPIVLVVFGSMIAYWGEGRIVLKRRLGLLQEIGTNWNPRFGFNHAIMINLYRLVEFYKGSRCILVKERADQIPKFLMYTCDRNKPTVQASPKEISETTAKVLLSLPPSIAVAYENPSAHSLRNFNRYIAYDINTLESSINYLNVCETLSNLFDEESFISVPYRQQGVASGRIFLTVGKREFSRSDVGFTQQVAEVMASVVENMHLIENLIAEAEGQERHRISLDVHDTTIQPYIGLTLALDALAQDFQNNTQLTTKIREIIMMANMTIQDLRSYKDTLREKSLMRGDVLISGVKNQVERLLRFYGIQIEVEGTVDPNLSGRLAEAAFQIIKEGLSNILRHTNAKKGFVNFQSTETELLLQIGNEVDNNARGQNKFKPKSIFERVFSLNGKALVETNQNGYTVLVVTIPLTKD
jgi:signal transduction histidine kinase